MSQNTWNFGYARHKILHQLYFIHSRCPQGSAENHMDMTTSFRKRVGVAYNTNKSQILDKNQIPEFRSSSWQAVQIWLKQNEVCRHWHRSLCEKQKKLSSWLEFLKNSILFLFPLWTFFFFWKITIIYMNPGRSNIFFSSPKPPDKLYSPPNLIYNDCSSPSYDTVKNEWRNNSTLLYALWHREDFTFLYCYM
jgi:hypothetical protein